LIGRREFLAGAVLPAIASAAGLEGAGIVDVHGHFAPVPEGAIWPLTLGNVLEDYDRCGIGIAVLSHFDAIAATSAAELRRATAESIEAVRAHTGRLRAYLVFHPGFAQESLAAMRDTARPGSPFVGFKLHTEIHRHDPDSPAYGPLYGFAHDHTMPVLMHVGPNVQQWVPAVRQIAKNYPQMPLIVAHYGGGEEQAVAVLDAKLPNLFIDTAVSYGTHRLIERLVAKVGAGRILFGTDAGYLNPGGQLARIAFADISEADRRAILGGNAKRIFGRRLPQ
jgi:uncharacterized protein